MIIWIKKNFVSCACLFDSIRWLWLFELRKTLQLVPVCSIQFNGIDHLHWEILRLVYLFLWFHLIWLTIWNAKNSPSCACLFDSIQWGWLFEMRKPPCRVTGCFIQFNGDDYFNWERLPIVCLAVWFHWMGMTIWIEKNSLTCAWLFDSIQWGWLFQSRKTLHRETFCLIQLNEDD